MSKAYYLVAGAVGAIIGLSVGYAIFALSFKGFYTSFVEWATGPSFGDAIVWTAMGAGLSTGITFLIRGSD